MTKNVSSLTFSFQNPGTFPVTKEFWHFQQGQSQGMIPPCCGGLFAWIVLWTHLSSLNTSLLPLDHLVTVCNISYDFFNCAPCPAPSFFSLTRRLIERTEVQQQSPSQYGRGRECWGWAGKEEGICACEIYCPFTLARIFWVLHVGDHHLTVVLKWHHLVQQDYLNWRLCMWNTWLHRQQCLSPSLCDTSSDWAAHQ